MNIITQSIIWVAIVFLIAIIVFIIIKKIKKKETLLIKLTNEINKNDKNISEYELYICIKNFLEKNMVENENYLNIIKVQAKENDIWQYINNNISIVAFVISFSALLAEIFMTAKVFILMSLCMFLIVIIVEWSCKYKNISKYREYIIEIIDKLQEK